MTYKETTEYLFSQLPMFEKQGAAGYKEGLYNTKEEVDALVAGIKRVSKMF